MKWLIKIFQLLWVVLKGLVKILLTPQVLAAFIGAGVLIWGYNFNAGKQREYEKFIRKLNAYENSLTQAELVAGSRNEDDIKKLNSIFVTLMLTAPDNVIKRINEDVIVNQENKFDREDFRKLQLILHEDLHGKSGLINEDYFPSFSLTK